MSEAHAHPVLLTVPGLGRASSCAGYTSAHRPRPLRYVWHHVLPQVAGGKTNKANLVSLCDSCHYSVHVLLWRLARANGDVPGWNRMGTAPQRDYARRGYDAAVAAGTAARIPNEGAAESS